MKIRLGSAEIRAYSLNGKIYAAPNLIFHYAKAHNYKPPEEFIWAVYLTVFFLLPWILVWRSIIKPGFEIFRS